MALRCVQAWGFHLRCERSLLKLHTLMVCAGAVVQVSATVVGGTARNCLGVSPSRFKAEKGQGHQCCTCGRCCRCRG